MDQARPADKTQNQNTDREKTRTQRCDAGEGAVLTEEERKTLCALNYKEAMAAIEQENPAVIALATEFIALYSERLGQRLKEGQDYLALLTARADTPAIERIAMELVLESAEAELDEEDPI